MERKSKRSSSSEVENERLKRRQELYSNAMKDLTDLRNHYRAELQTKLEEKVARQRKEREEKKVLEEETQKEIKRKQFPHNFTIKLPKSNVTDDKQYLENIRFSKFYLINEIRNQLEKNNELDKKYKVDEFHKFIHSPNVLEMIRNEIVKGNTITLEKIKDIAQWLSQREENFLNLDNEMNKDIVKGKEQTKLNEGRRDFTRQKRSTDNMEVMFPPIQYPELKIVNRNLDSNEPSTAQDTTSKRGKRRDEIEKRKRILQRMYSVSQSYEAATNRLIKKYKKWNFQEISGTKDTEDMIACGSETNSSCEEGDLDITVQRLSIDNAPHDSEIDTNIHRYLKSINELLLNDEPLEPNYEDRTTDIIKESTKSTRDLIKERETQLKKWEGRVYSDGTLRREVIEINDDHREPPKPAPLTMQALEETAKVKIIKESAVWINPEQ